jgi:hypothetical protein
VDEEVREELKTAALSRFLVVAPAQAGAKLNRGRAPRFFSPIFM